MQLLLSDVLFSEELISSGQTSSTFMPAEDNTKMSLLFKVYLHTDSQELILSAVPQDLFF